MEKISTILAYVGLAVMLVGLGYVCGQRSAKVVISKMETTTHDTLWVEVHDTCWKETAVSFLRTDTVRLAVANVPDSAVSGTLDGSNGHENAISGTHQDGYGNENAVSRTYTDTLFVHDSVYVEVPIESHTFIGDHYRIMAHGYRVGLDDVWFDRQVINAVTTQTKYANKRWRFSVGAQMGYGYTIHGASPYVGIGAGFGYTF